MRKNPTRSEDYFWQKVRRKQLFGLKINRQFIIEYQNNNRERKYFIVDFYCHQYKLIIELDGGIHSRRIEYDLAGEGELKSDGILHPSVYKSWIIT